MKSLLTVTLLLSLAIFSRSASTDLCKEDSECTDTYGSTACCAYVKAGDDDGHVCADRTVLEAWENLSDEERDAAGDIGGEMYCDNAITLLAKSAIVSVGAFFALY